MSFSFVVEGQAGEGNNMDGDTEMKAVQEAIQQLFITARTAGVFMRVGSFNPPSWAPNPQTNEGEFHSEAPSAAATPFSEPAEAGTASPNPLGNEPNAKGSIGDSGDGPMGVPQTASGPEGQVTQTSS